MAILLTKLAYTVLEKRAVLPDTTAVIRVEDIDRAALANLLARFDLTLTPVPAGAPIPGSFWGDEEAGLRGDRLYTRDDTPLHSVLHESGHYVCMDPRRRAGLDTNAGGDYDEENAVCYWQIAVTDALAGTDRERMCADMDTWGYTFRLGSAAAWFADDAEDARAWLTGYGLIDDDGRVQFVVRDRL